ncbi:murein biosynthesis integral membrane protein MurJ [Gordonia amarae]|uniref:Murein biosynthesis integral membrane protein MurJ n=1 Tax=Gordonia amarae TaxID=36821 RepID=A0A857L6G8_9ACTN|nr:murein biosynthesis integral membrane protein MurJ [Gordonia amarae]QHN24600.1 murein biosynthesis integral membrane protein MurJ [Gordonia amarae]QHN42249.1 murein biosynthesis integral membrane protein MurJ [Gordonia amarae]
MQPTRPGPQQIPPGNRQPPAARDHADSGEPATPALNRRPPAAAPATPPVTGRPAPRPAAQRPVSPQPTSGPRRPVQERQPAHAEPLVAGTRGSNSTGDVDETRAGGPPAGNTLLKAPGKKPDTQAADTHEPPPEDSDSSILKTGGSIALATLFSRITGFLRTVLILSMLGSGLASAFQAADVLPNMIAEVVLGAVLTAIVIPLLARAEAEDPDGGESFTNKIFTLVVVVLGVATVVAVIAAPVLTFLNVGDGKVDRDLSTALAYLLLPEILFYGLTALFIAILNMRGYFKPGAWAPVLNNIVQISALVAFRLVPGEITLNPVKMSDPKLLVLGVGCSLGVVLQAMILVPWLRRAGVRLRLEWGIDARLRQFGNMAVAIIGYVLVLQVGMMITYRIASSAAESGISAYFTHWQLLQLPYGILGVTILTAIMPRLSRNAAAKDHRAVVEDMSLATRLTMVSLVPIVAFMTFFGPAIAIAVFNFGNYTQHDAEQLGSVLAWGAFTLIPYAMTLVQLRVFYAREDPWTPTAMVVGITGVKVVASYLGTVLFDDADQVVRWLALSNGLGYLVGAIVGHQLLRRRLGAFRMTDVKRTTIVSIATSVLVTAAVWAVAELSGLSNLSGHHGKIGSLAYLVITAVVVLGIVYSGLAACKVPDVVAIFDAVQRLLGRFIPALAPKTPPSADSAASLTLQFPRVGNDDALPYSGQVQIMRRFDRGTSSWQSYAVHSGGATGMHGAYAANRMVLPPDTRYRRRGFGHVSETSATQAPNVPETLAADAAAPVPPAPVQGIGANDAPTKVVNLAGMNTPDSPETDAPETADTENTPDAEGGTPKASDDQAAPDGPPLAPEPAVRGPRLIAGAAVAGGRYRLLEGHGGTRGLQFWRARDTNLDREVALTFVDADQMAPAPARGTQIKVSDTGPQAVLARTLRLGQVNSPGVARVLDVVRGSSGGIVVSEWVPGSSLTEVAKSGPSPIGAARAVRALAAAAEAAHRSGGALSIDHPDRIRISSDGNAVLAFPGTLAGDDKASDVRGLGAVLYALLLDRWPLDAATGSKVITTNDTTEPVGGLEVAVPDKDGVPVEPLDARTGVPFEISAVAARALDGNRGIRTAATVQQVLDQATVVDLKTDLLPTIDSDQPPVSVTPRKTETDPAKRNMAVLIGLGLAIAFIILAIVAWATGIFGDDDEATDIDSILPTTSAPAATTGNAAPQPAAPAPAPAGPVGLRSVSLVDFSGQPADSSANLRNVVSGAAPAWQTDNYRGRSDFGGLKSGMGLMFALDKEHAIKSVTIRTNTPGFDVSVRSASSATPGGLEQTKELAAGRVTGRTLTIPVNGAAPTGHVMVWIKSLPPSGNGGYQASIAQVSMTG